MDEKKCNECLEKDFQEYLKKIEHEMDKLPGSVENYKKISRMIIISFLINSTILIALNIPHINLFLANLLGNLKFEILKQFFFGSIGGTITCSLFLSKDMEINAIESVKKNPDPEVLRYPNIINVHLYFHRMLNSGIFAILGCLIMLAGFSYINYNYSEFTIKHKILFAISSILIGIFQHKFIRRIGGVFDKIYNPEDKKDDKSDKDNYIAKTNNDLKKVVGNGE